jgi:hypothetical protein
VTVTTLVPTVTAVASAGYVKDIMVEPMTGWGRHQAFGHGAATSLTLLMVTPLAVKTAAVANTEATMATDITTAPAVGRS